MGQSLSEKHLHFFVFCGKDEEGKPSLFKEVCKKLERSQIPDHLSIIPLPFQDPVDIAKIMARSDRKFTRAGGSTAFEHKVMHQTLGDANGKVHIISEMGLKRIPHETQARHRLLLSTIPVWEGGNAQNLCETIGAELIHVKSLEQQLASDFT